MQPTQATRWFGPLLVASAIAAATTIGVSAFVQSRLLSAEPETRRLIPSPPQSRPDERPPVAVTIEPSHIVVIGRRSPSLLDMLADWLPHPKESS